MPTAAADKKLSGRSDLLSVDKDLTVLSLFSGCGGMDLGFEGGFKVHHKSVNDSIHPEWVHKDGPWNYLPETRFTTVFANDILETAETTWRNFFSKKGINKNTFVRDSIVDLVKRHNSSNKKVFPEVDVVTGGFPCQDFSVAGKRKGFDSDKNHNGVIREESEPNEENRGKIAK